MQNLGVFIKIGRTISEIGEGMKIVDIYHGLGHSNFDVIGVHAFGSQHEADAGYRFDSLRFISKDNDKVRLAYYKIGPSGTYSIYALLNIK